METKTGSPKETQKIAGKLAKTLKRGDVVALFGDLGAGKTVFVQGLAQGLGIKRRILSPTFVFMRSYPFTLRARPPVQRTSRFREGPLSKSETPSRRQGRRPSTFYHIDLYRGEDINDFKALGLDEIFSEDSIVVLEWAEKIKDKLPQKRIDVEIIAIDEKIRKITIKRYTPNTSGMALSEVEGDSPEVERLNRAAEILKSGGVVIFPTDTVYGIGCRHDFQKSVERIRQNKKTPENQQFPILVSDVGQVKKIARITPPAQKLIDKYWPGALTIILPSRHRISKIGLRMPNSDLIKLLIKKVGVGIIGTSANFHQKATPRSFDQLDPKFVKLADYVLEGECKTGIESTVVDATSDPPKILRKGAISLP